jgi:putative transposase
MQEALLFFDGDRYRLHAWRVMPNHVHVMVTPASEHMLGSLVQAWKGFTARRINQAHGRGGPLWFREYFDRKIRNESHFEIARHYIEQNPVEAALCKTAAQWAFSSAAG